MRRDLASSPGAWVLLALFVLAADCRRAGGAPDSHEPIPLAEVAKSFPAPSSERAFKLDLDLAAAGIWCGGEVISVEPTVEDGVAAWLMEEEWTVGPGTRWKRSVVVGADLVMLRGTAEDKKGPRTYSSRWHRTKEGYDLRITDPDGGTTTSGVAAPDGLVLDSRGSLFLMSRLIPSREAAYVLHTFREPLGSLSPHTRHVTVAVMAALATPTEPSKSVLLLNGRIFDHSLTLAADLRTRAFRALRWNDWRAEAVPRGRATPQVPVEWQGPPMSALDGAMKAEVARIMGDEVRLDSMVDWDRSLEAARRSKWARETKSSEFRARVLSRGRWQHADLQATQSEIASRYSGAEVEEITAFRMRVAPEGGSGGAMEWERDDGKWRIVSLPTNWL